MGVVVPDDLSPDSAAAHAAAAADTDEALEGILSIPLAPSPTKLSFRGEPAQPCWSDAEDEDRASWRRGEPAMGDVASPPVAPPAPLEAPGIPIA